MAVSPKRNPADIAADILAFPLPDGPSGPKTFSFEEKLFSHIEIARDSELPPPNDPFNAAVDKRADDYEHLAKALHQIADGKTVTQQHKQIIQQAPELLRLLIEATRYDAGHSQDMAAAPDKDIAASLLEMMHEEAKSRGVEISEKNIIRRLRHSEAEGSKYCADLVHDLEGVQPLITELADVLGVKLEGRAPGK